MFPQGTLLIGRLRNVRLVLWFVLISPINAQSLPRFEDYKIDVYKGKTVDPRPPAPSDRQLRCCLWFEDSGPVNFAGRYRLTEDTCGSECRTVHIVDRATGRHFVAGSYGSSYIFTYRDLPDGVEYRPDSRLLIVHGCPREKNCGSYYLLMNPNGLRQLKYVPFGIKSEFN